jgi:hypothetical protein
MGTMVRDPIAVTTLKQCKLGFSIPAYYSSRDSWRREKQSEHFCAGAQFLCCLAVNVLGELNVATGYKRSLVFAWNC